MANADDLFVGIINISETKYADIVCEIISLMYVSEFDIY